MSKYRKKPVVVEAFRFNKDQQPEWFKEKTKTGEINVEGTLFGSTARVFIKTLEGTMIAQQGDYIIKGINGEIYPCKADIFEKTYEEVAE